MRSLKPVGCLIMLFAAFWFIYTMYRFDDVNGFEGTLMWVVFFIGFRIASIAQAKKTSLKEQDEILSEWRSKADISYKSTYDKRKTEISKDKVNPYSWYDKSFFFHKNHEFQIGEFTCYYLFNYFPIKSYSKVPREVAVDRGFIYDFKDGNNSGKAADLISSAIYDIFKHHDMNNIIFAVVPASTQEKTDLRFKSFCERVSDNLKIKNGFEFD